MKKKYENLVNTFKNVEQYSDEISDENLKTSKIVFDANVLLDIYLYPKKDRKKIFNLLKRAEIKERLFMPYQVLFEFFKNRNKMIKKLEKYKNGINCEDDKNGEIINKLMKFLEETMPKTENIDWNKTFKLEGYYIEALTKNEDVIKKLETCFSSYSEKIKKIHQEIEGEIKDVFKGIEKEDISLENDPILKELFKIFENKIGEECTAENYISIQMEGLERMIRNVPLPGSEDLKEKIHNEFGDFFIWKEIKNINDNIIFVSQEKKEDWIEKTIPNTLKIALKEEHKESTSKEINLIRFKGFIDKISEIYEIPERDRVEIPNVRYGLAYPSAALSLFNLERLDFFDDEMNEGFNIFDNNFTFINEVFNILDDNLKYKFLNTMNKITADEMIDSKDLELGASSKLKKSISRALNNFILLNKKDKLQLTFALTREFLDMQAKKIPLY